MIGHLSMAARLLARERLLLSGATGRTRPKAVPAAGADRPSALATKGAVADGGRMFPLLSSRSSGRASSQCGTHKRGRSAEHHLSGVAIKEFVQRNAGWMMGQAGEIHSRLPHGQLTLF